MPASRLIDISPLVSPRIAVWPGDQGFERRVSMKLEDGDPLALSSILTTVHDGAHADAPAHYRAGGVGIAARSLELYYGPCQVVRVDLPPDARVEIDDLDGPLRAPRVLFHTGSFADAEDWNPHFNSLSADLIRHLAAHGVVLVGIDTPSIDPQEDQVLPSHNAVADHDMAILEGLVLDHVDPGLYTLIALPLKLEDADASPVRAVLLQDHPA